MDIQSSILFGTVLYKVISLLVGLASCYMGYRLFISGIWGQAGDLNAQFGNNKLVLKNAAPGTFFAVLGTIIICFTLWKRLNINQSESSNALAPSSLERNISTSNGGQIVLPEELPE